MYICLIAPVPCFYISCLVLHMFDGNRWVPPHPLPPTPTPHSLPSFFTVLKIILIYTFVTTFVFFYMYDYEFSNLNLAYTSTYAQLFIISYNQCSICSFFPLIFLTFFLNLFSWLYNTEKMTIIVKRVYSLWVNG